MNERPCHKISVPKNFDKTSKTKQQITSTLCALFNTKYGGTIEFSPEEGPWTNEDQFKRSVEQKIQNLAGKNYLCNRIEWDSGKVDGKLLLLVEQTDELNTVDYNLWRASDTQVLSFKSGDMNIDEVRTILTKRQIPREKGKVLGSHCKNVVKNEKFELSESKKVQLKMFKCEKTPNVGLRDRIMNNKNKVAKTISAFANTYGGDIYCGISDDGDILGESIAEKSEEKITAAVAKAINTMIWPQEHGKPKQGEQWDIYFEPVKDHKGNSIPNCFVIVISVAPSPSGVFVEQPESYYIGDKGKVEKMSFEMWKDKIFATTTSGEEQVNASSQQADETIGSKVESLGILKGTERESKEMKASSQQADETIGSKVESLAILKGTERESKEVKASSQQSPEIGGLNLESPNSSSATVTQKEYTRLHEKFDRLRENGEWMLFWNEIESLRKSKSVDVQLIAYYQSTCATYMHKDLKKCKKFRKEFKKLIKESENSAVFKVEALFMKAAMRRSEEMYKDSAMLLSQAVELAATITPGLTTAWVHCMYAVAITMMAKDAGDSEEARRHVDKAKLHFRRAREHAETLDEFPKAKRDLIETVLINEALLNLGSCIRGNGLLSASPLSIEEISTLDENLKKEMEQASQLTNSQCQYYFILHELMRCDLNYRQSQLHQRRLHYWKTANTHAKTAMDLAMKNGFPELFNYSRNRLAYLAHSSV